MPASSWATLGTRTRTSATSSLRWLPLAGQNKKQKKVLLQERPFLQQFTMNDLGEHPFPVSAYPACVVVLAPARKVTHSDEKPAWSTWGTAFHDVGDAVPTSFRGSMFPIAEYNDLSLGDADRGSGQQLRGFGHLHQKAADITSVPRGLLTVSVFVGTARTGHGAMDRRKMSRRRRHLRPRKKKRVGPMPQQKPKTDDEADSPQSEESVATPSF